jgi:hypothetical protein
VCLLCLRGFESTLDHLSMRRLKRSHCSIDLSHVWKEACFKAFGLEDWEFVEPTDCSKDLDVAILPSSESSQFNVINLLNQLDDVRDDEINENGRDPWMETARHIHSNIHEMTMFLSNNRFDYIQLDTSDDDASLIQSTVASFIATTAAEIESLHQCLSTTPTNQKQSHCAGVVQILMIELKERVAEPFGFLSKQRQRAAVELWQTPIQSRLWIPNFFPKEKDATLELLGLDDDDEDELVDKASKVDQRFLFKRLSHRLHTDFWQSYETSKHAVRRQQPPASLSQRTHEVAHPSTAGYAMAVSDVTSKPKSFATRQLPQVPVTFLGDDDDGGEDFASSAAGLQQEAMLLQMKTHSDLDSVQKMEQAMVDITTLLSQFANLVVEQQENVWDIHDATVTTKENIQQGKENLEDAKERVAASKHYMASAITAMGILLLLLHWLRP